MAVSSVVKWDIMLIIVPSAMCKLPESGEQWAKAEFAATTAAATGEKQQPDSTGQQRPT